MTNTPQENLYDLTINDLSPYGFKCVLPTHPSTVHTLLLNNNLPTPSLKVENVTAVGELVLSNKFDIPLSSSGSQTDARGSVRFDNDALYVCVEDFKPAQSAVWKKIPLVDFNTSGLITTDSSTNNNTIAGTLNLGFSDTDSSANFNISRVRDPEQKQDVATKNYVDQHFWQYDILSNQKRGGTLGYSKLESTLLTGGKSNSVTLINLSNYSGYVSSINITIYSLADLTNMMDGLISVYVDGESNPSISLPLSALVGGSYMNNVLKGQWGSKYFGGNINNASSFNCYFRLPIPFNSSIRILLYNGSSNYSSTVQSTVAYQYSTTQMSWPNTGKLHCDFTTQTALQANSVQQLVSYSGGHSGRYVGMYFLADCVANTVSPYGAELQGDFEFFMNSQTTPSYVSSGTDDYFMQGSYGVGTTQGSVSAGGEIGRCYVSTSTNAVDSFFRIHDSDPWYFDNTGFAIKWHCGDTVQVPFTGTVKIIAVCYYYTQQ